MNMKKSKIYLLIALLGLVFSACEYDFEAVEVIPPVEGDVSFSASINPIFQNKCASCHKVGGVKPVPDLTTDNAYNSINSAKYINTDSPESSLIYTEPSPDGTHGGKYSRAEAALVLTWIQQGAQNN